MPEIRRYQETDIPQMVEALGTGLQDYHYRTCSYAPAKVTKLLIANRGNNNFFCNVIASGDHVSGGLCASILDYMMSYETYAQDHLFFIRDGHSLKAVNDLIKSYVEWARSRKVRAVRLDQSTGFKMDKFAVLLKRRGFQQVGTTFQMEF